MVELTSADPLSLSLTSLGLSKTRLAFPSSQESWPYVCRLTDTEACLSSLKVVLYRAYNRSGVGALCGCRTSPWGSGRQEKALGGRRSSLSRLFSRWSEVRLEPALRGGHRAHRFTVLGVTQPHVHHFIPDDTAQPNATYAQCNQHDIYIHLYTQNN